MARLHLEFMVEPFVEGRPGPHVTAAVDAVRRAGLQVEMGPFGSSATGEPDDVADATAALLRQAFALGAERVSLRLELAEGRRPDPAATPATGPRAGEGPAATTIGTARRGAGGPGGSPLDLNGALGRMLAELETELTAPLADLGREAKQVAVRVLDERGAFNLRRSIEDVADALGVSRVTIYNYLDAIRAAAPAADAASASTGRAPGRL